MRKTKRPRLVFQPKTYQGMQKGINLIAAAIRPTLGPLPRHVAIDRVVKTEKQSYAELLDNGGLIARRILQLADPDADMGAMFMRQLLWQQHEQAGDGTALTAVLFQTVYNEGLKYIAAGGNAMRLRFALERGMRITLHELRGMISPLEGETAIAQLAESVCHDVALARVLGEVFDIIGAYGQLEIRSSHSREIRHEFIRGTFLKSGVLSKHMLENQPGARISIENAAILLTDLEFETPDQLIPALQTIFENDIKGLVIFARKISDKVMSVLLAASRQLPAFRLVAVSAPNALHGQSVFLQDLEVLTGGRAFLKAAGDTLASFQISDLGRARQAWADKTYVGFVGAQGTAREMSRHVASLQSSYASADKPDDRQRLVERISLFMGGAGVIWVGGLSEHDIKARKELTERTSLVLRKALMTGVLSGGGVALLRCRAALKRLDDESDDLDEQMAYRILHRALQEPTCAILRNGGFNPGPILHDIESASNGCGFDVRSGSIVDMREVGVIDSAAVILTAVHEAVASAALALTVDVLVHHRKPEQAFEP